MSAQKTKSHSEHYLVITLFLLLLAAFHLIYGRFFPLPGGDVGEDNALGFSLVYDGYLWFRNNGLFHIPWFTPSFCGGVPSYFDPQSGFFSLPQLLTFVTNPLLSFYLSFLFFASVGFWGFYFLLKKIFKLTWHSAMLGAALFMFNGFFVSRMLIGHGVFMPFMLVPWITYCLLINPQANFRENLRLIVLIGLQFTFWIQAGMVSLAIPSGIAILLLCLLRAFNSPSMLKLVCIRLLAAMILTLLLCAAKLVGMFAFMAHFARADYRLPGADGLLDSINLGLQMLFVSPADTDKQLLPMITNYQWEIGRQELDYGVTWVPAIIFLVSVCHYFFVQRTKPNWQFKQYIILVVMMCLLLLPFLLNLYTPLWNAFLKSLPIIKSNSNLLRWYVIDIPIIIALSALCVGKISQQRQSQIRICFAAIIFILLSAIMTDKTYYTEATYSSNTILAAYKNLKTSSRSPKITAITAVLDDYGFSDFLLNRNDYITQGLSPILCYYPAFGYRLENFPVKTLHPGSIFSEQNGVLNLKNPACYVYPAENHCEPGDQFTVKQKEEARAFAEYRPFHFAVSGLQHLANKINLVALILLSIFIVWEIARRIKEKLKNSCNPILICDIKRPAILKNKRKT